MKRIIIFFFIGLIFLTACKTAEVGIKECNVDADCVRASCCHAASCVPADKAVDCSGIYCSQECKENTLDCGQGKCICDNWKCGVEWNEQ